MIRKVARQSAELFIVKPLHEFHWNKDKKCPGARRTFSLLFCQTFRLNFRLFCDNPCYSNINPGAFQNLSTLSEQNLSLIANKSLWYWFLKSCVWPKNLNIISHGLEITNENFCDNFASGQKKPNKAEKLSQARPGLAGCWFWIKKILLFWFWCKDRQGGLARGSWDWDWSWVIKLIMPGVVLWCCGETTQETSGQSPQPLEMTW